MWQNSRLSEPSEKERKLWKLLKDVRRRQAFWRSQERKKVRKGIINPDNLPQGLVREASKIFVALKERKCSYGDYVFNFAFPSTAEDYPKPLRLPSNLAETLWSLAATVENPEPKGLKMLRIDAIRQADDTIKIIELNPCWVDNLGALQSFYETYGLTSLYDKPISLFAQRLRKSQPERANIALTYCFQADGCRKDEIYGLRDYLQVTCLFQSIVVASLREVRQESDGSISVGGIPVSSVYLNGSFSMARDSISEQEAVRKIQSAQANGLVTLAPAQFEASDQKDSLVEFSKRMPEIFVKTERNPSSFQFPFIAKPFLSRSLYGVKIIRSNEDLRNFSPDYGYVFQPLTIFKSDEIVCFNSKTKTISKPPQVYEKINIWIIEDKIIGVLATFGQTPLISDSDYNLPLLWEEI